MIQSVRSYHTVGGIRNRMTKGIPALKAKPELIPGVLQRIKDNLGNYKKMEEEVASFWQGKSQRIKAPTVRNSLRAVFGPSLRHLHLIRGEGNELTLTAPGKQLLRVYLADGEVSFKKALARHFLKLDKDEWAGVIFELQKLNRTVSVEELLHHLKREPYDEPHMSHDRLTKFLWYYAYVGLVKFDGKMVELRQRQLENCLQGLDIKISNEEFIHALIEQYEKLRGGAQGSPYIPIPDLRDEVCEKTGIWLDYFDTMLERIPKETSEYMIHLTQPMLRKAGGIRIAGKYLYYIAIFKKG